MKRILVICFVIIISIVIADVLMQKYVDNTFEMMCNKLGEVENNIDNPDVCKVRIDEINSMWEKNFKKLACYLEHNELEKVKTQLVIIEAGINVEDKEFVFEEVNRAIYIIDHIKHKERLKIDNIF